MATDESFAIKSFIKQNWYVILHQIYVLFILFFGRMNLERDAVDYLNISVPFSSVFFKKYFNSLTLMSSFSYNFSAINNHLALLDVPRISEIKYVFFSVMTCEVLSDNICETYGDILRWRDMNTWTVSSPKYQISIFTWGRCQQRFIQISIALSVVYCGRRRAQGLNIHEFHTRV